MHCEICKRGVEDLVTLHRVNETGVSGVWRCEAHLTPEQRAKIDPELKRLTDILSGRKAPEPPEDEGYHAGGS